MKTERVIVQIFAELNVKCNMHLAEESIKKYLEFKLNSDDSTGVNVNPQSVKIDILHRGKVL